MPELKSLWHWTSGYLGSLEVLGCQCLGVCGCRCFGVFVFVSVGVWVCRLFGLLRFWGFGGVVIRGFVGAGVLGCPYCRCLTVSVFEVREVLGMSEI